MKLWIVMLIFGKIGAAIGPLPYGLDECRIKAEELVQDYKQKWEIADKKGVHPMLDDKVLGRDDLKAECRYSTERPKLDKFK